MKSLTTKAAVLAVVTAFTLPAANAENFVRLSSGTPGGTWYPSGATFMKIIGEKVPDVATLNTIGQGGVANARIVNNGGTELGFTFQHTGYQAYTGTGPYKEKNENIRHVATLYASTFQVAVPKSSDIKSFNDMADARVSPGKSGQTGTVFAETILNAHDITFESIKENGGVVHHVGYSDTVSLMKDGHVDVFMAATSMPQASFIELNHSLGVRFIGLSAEKQAEILDANPGFIKGLIPAGTYEGQDEDVLTLGLTVELIANKDVPEEIIYQVTKTFWDQATLDEMAATKAVWKTVKVENALNGVAIPIHPGAERFYKEVGVTVK